VAKLSSRADGGTFRLLNDPVVEGVMLFEFEPTRPSGTFQDL
jgi:hypothetical protein